MSEPVLVTCQDPVGLDRLKAAFDAIRDEAWALPVEVVSPDEYERRVKAWRERVKR